MSNLPPSKKKPSNDYLKYSGMAFQFLGAILLGVFLGQWLDRKFNTEKPVFTITLSLFFVIASLVLTVKDLLKKS
ncbi:MAG: AtpZ/AtpI family protein [Chitinophagales bacterium]|nr:AtpZ/AtpI family protein [Chitinophagales bacterium]